MPDLPIAAIVALLAATPAAAKDLLFPDVAMASIRRNHPEFARNPLYVFCRAPGGRTTEFREAPRIAMGTMLPGPVVYRMILDKRCERPWNWAAGAAPPDLGVDPYSVRIHRHHCECDDADDE